MQMSSARLRAQFGLLAAAVVFGVAFSIVLAGTFERPNLRVGLPGSPALGFRLPDPSGKMTHFASLKGRVVVLCFASSPETPYAAAQMSRLAQLGEQFGPGAGVKLVAIRSNTEEMTEDQQREIELQAEAGGRCQTLLDPTGHVARLYRIDQTPTFVIIDPAGMIRYRGGMDDPSPDAPVTAMSFPSLIDLLLAERLPGQPAPAVLSKTR
jgi:peroxiredoxin